MIVRVFASGKSCGSGVVNYLLSENDHTGQQRAIKPEILEGSPSTTIEIIDSIGRGWKYVSGAIAFRNNEHPSREQMHQIIDQFKSAVCPGLDVSQFKSLFVLHRDKGNDEIHFVVPMIELTTGKRLNIHPPGEQNLALYNAFVQVMNQDLGYSQVVSNPLKIALPSHKLKSPEFKNDQRKSDLLQTHIHQAITTGKVENRAQLCKWMDDELGINITRQGKDYISVKLPGDKKAHRLRGPLFEENANYREILEVSRQSKVPVKLTDTEYQLQKTRLAELVSERGAFNSIAYSKAKPVRLGGIKREIPAPKISAPTNTHTLAPIKITTTMEAPKMFNTPIFKKIINDALMAILMGRPTPKPKPAFQPVLSKDIVNQRKETIREKAYPARDGQSKNAGIAIATLLTTLGQIGMSIQEAIADIANAKDHKQTALAQQRLRMLQDQQFMLNQQLREAKANMTSALKPK